MISARPATADESARWDELIGATGRPHLLQSDGWARLKAANGWLVRRFVFEQEGRATEGSGAGAPVSSRQRAPARSETTSPELGTRQSRVLEQDGVAQVLLRRLPLGLVAAYAPRGPLVAHADVPGAIIALAGALRSERCTSLLCDPEVPVEAFQWDALLSAGIGRSPVHVQPTRTLLLDLTIDPDELLARMRKKTRQYIRKAERAGVVTADTQDVERFHRVLERVAERDRFAIHDVAYFRRIAEAFGAHAHFQIASVGAVDAGALLVVRVGDRAWELFGGWSGDHAEERPFYLLKWRSFMRMRELGAVRYDMWGLTEGGGADEEGKGPRRGTRDDPLKGVENFKLGFGGEIAEWIGALEVPVRRALYPLWRFAGRRRLARSA